MMSLVTKSTHKKTKLNKKYIGKKLDNIAKNVAKRGVFVISYNKNIGMFEIIEAVSKRVVLTHLPNKNLANVLCVRLNRQKMHIQHVREGHFFRKPQKLINKYVDVKNECMFYRHTMKTTKDDFRFESTRHRLIEGVLRQKHALQQVKNLF